MTASPSPERGALWSALSRATSGMDRTELEAWLTLLEAPGIGRLSARRLLLQHGSPEALLAACEARPSSSPPPEADDQTLPPAAARAIVEARPRVQALCDQTLAWLAADSSRHLLTLGDPYYPALLLESPDPPLLLHAQGRLELLEGVAVAIVGSRQATAQGLDNARHFATTFSQAGLTVVSGLALGIDTAAHEGGMRGPGSTVAVVGTGLDTMYPRRSEALGRRILAEGLMLSEHPLGTPPRREHFPQRNRLIAGLARGTLLVEAALPSGTLITARQALEAGRDVYAIPGSIHSPQSRGCHALIKQGAALVDDPQDVIDALGWTSSGPSDPRSLDRPTFRPTSRPTPRRTPSPTSRGAPPPPGDPGVDIAPETDPDAAPESLTPLLRHLGHDPVSLDALQARGGWPVAELQARLLEAELMGLVVRLPGGRFQRRGRA